jgi:poly(3-hydroxyalkanoate) synthetase
MVLDGKTLAQGRQDPDLQSGDPRGSYRAGAIGVPRQPVLRRPVDFVLAGSGHIAGVVNPPDKKKYQYWTGGAVKGDYEDWLGGAEETAGSWWPHWQTWIEAATPGHRSGRTQRQQPAPRAPGSPAPSSKA